MVVTIQQALIAGNATPDDVAVILDRLGTDGYAGEKAAGSAFLLLKPEDYEETLNPYQRNLIRAAQLAQGGGAGVPLGCMLWQGRCTRVTLVSGAGQGACCLCCCKEQPNVIAGSRCPLHHGNHVLCLLVMCGTPGSWPGLGMITL